MFWALFFKSYYFLGLNKKNFSGFKVVASEFPHARFPFAVSRGTWVFKPIKGVVSLGAGKFRVLPANGNRELGSHNR